MVHYHGFSWCIVVYNGSLSLSIYIYIIVSNCLEIITRITNCDIGALFSCHRVIDDSREVLQGGWSWSSGAQLHRGFKGMTNFFVDIFLGVLLGNFTSLFWEDHFDRITD